MADEPSIHEEFSDAHNAEMSDEIAELNQKINDLEQENGVIDRENKELKQRVEELRSENEDLRNQVKEAEADKKLMEAEIARLNQGLASATSHLQVTNFDLSGLKMDLEIMRGREKEKDDKLEVAEREKALLRAELDGKDKQIQGLKKNVMGNGEIPEPETKIEEMKDEINILQNSLDEKERVIRDLDALVYGGKKGSGSIGGLRDSDWLVVGSTTIAAVAVLGAVCYVRAARKH